MDSQLFLQDDLLSRMTKAKVNFKKTPKERITKEYVEGRLENLDKLWSEFMSGHKELICTNERKELLKTEYFKDETYDKAEESYLNFKCELKSVLCKFTNPSDFGKQTSEIAKTSFVKLPKINISPFSGQYSEWSTFRDLFRSLVHQNSMLDNVQKMHYLKGYLVGEAEQLLRHIPIASDNYERCWSLLEKRYNNKRYICHHILKRFFSQRNIINESASGIKDLMDTSNDCLFALTNLGIDIKSWDVIVVYILSLKLDSESRRQWEFSITNSNTPDDLPTYEQFKDFLTNRYRAMEFLDTKSNTGNLRNQPSGSNTNRVKTLHVSNLKCPFCSEEHRLYVCKLFLNESVENRRNFVQDNNVCFICLGNNHAAKNCTFKGRCRVCKRNHHTFLHPTVGTNDTSAVNCAIDETEEDGEAAESGDSRLNDNLVSCFSKDKVYGQVLLATAVVNARSRDGQSYPLRALLDQGSQSSFITEATVQYLRLRKTAVMSQISGLGNGKNIISKAKVNIEVASRVNPEVVFTVSAYVLRSITTLIPTKRVEALNLRGFEDIQLADPNYHTPNRIDLLLGAEVYGKILQNGLRRGPNGTPIAQSTSLGWVLSGVVESSSESPSNIHVLHCCVDDNELLKKFWEIEADPISRKKVLTDDEQRCENLFSETTRRDNQGKYIVRLPLGEGLPAVRDSLSIAAKRLESLERRLNKNKNLKHGYTKVMEEYLSLSHMELVPTDEIENPRAVYLPQHVVIRNDKDTTKIRVVCDASCKGNNNKSLNDHLLIGPTLQPELRHLVMRWRVPVICLAADIVKMYRQVRVDAQDADLQRILWRPNESSEILHYRLLTVTFGTASAPYLAVRALQQLSVDEGNYYPKASERVLTDFYMDDLLTGCNNVEEGIQIYEEMKQLLSKGGFVLQKWTSNSNKLLESMRTKENENINENLNIKTDEVIKIVGLTWNRHDDTFRYTVNFPTMALPETKRKLLSNISKFYDPLGWVGPSILLAKMLIQKLWLAGLDWDEPVPDQIAKEWSTYQNELKALTHVSVPRWLGTKANDVLVELHGFCDASKSSYAAVVYIRTVDMDGKVHVGLVSAKTKVGPVKQISIPRMELCGAVLLVRLIMEIADVMKVEKRNIHAWTDSTIVLAWLNSHPNRWKVFVANRVTEIQTNLDSHQWSHISSDQNPADCASRGLRPSELVNNAMWFEGPEFLSKNEIKYTKPKNLETEIEHNIKVHCTAVEETLWERFSSLRRMIRVIAYCVRFVNKLRKRRIFQSTERYSATYLSSKELANALNICIKQCQAQHFAEEMSTIKQNKDLPRNSKLRALNPYLDDLGMMRVGGRLQYSKLSEDRKHPIVLPQNSHLSDLIVSDAHRQTLHGGPQLMLTYIQSKFWLLRAKQLVKLHYRNCVICVKNNATTHNQLMGQAPASRVTPSRAFKCSGVDYAGPIQIRMTQGRGHRSHKGYICLFICMATRAIHLEVVSDLSAQGFLQAYKRFVARRGPCLDLWSDNGTNFTGAASELKRLFKSEQRDLLTEIAESLAANGCEWHFIPPHAPNFGGLWEAGVKSVKYHLKRVIGNSTLTYEEMSTVLAQIEACLNSRPLSVVTDDPDSEIVLTPGHFLVGEALVTAPDYNYESSNVGSLRRWQYTQKMMQEFWRRWSQEYLTKFLHRYRWSTLGKKFSIGDIVVVKEDGLPPSRWLYGKVIATHAGHDKIVRVVTLKTQNGTIKRPTSKLCLLPVQTD